MAHVNLWELITTVAGQDLLNADNCREIKASQEAGDCSFGTQLDLEVDMNGRWRVEVFNHEDPGQKVELTIYPNGDVAVTRKRGSGDIHDTRTLMF